MIFEAPNKSPQKRSSQATGSCLTWKRSTRILGAILAGSTFFRLVDFWQKRQQKRVHCYCLLPTLTKEVSWTVLAQFPSEVSFLWVVDKWPSRDILWEHHSGSSWCIAKPPKSARFKYPVSGKHGKPYWHVRLGLLGGFVFKTVGEKT